MYYRFNVQIKPDGKGHKPEMHMNEHGITLRHGEHKGRLLRPTRYYGSLCELQRHDSLHSN